MVKGAYGVTLELRGGGDEGDDDEGDAVKDERNARRESRYPPALSALVLGTDNPARARNRALRAGASGAKPGSPAAGERCSGDAFLGCGVSLVGFPVTFVKTSAAKVRLRGERSISFRAQLGLGEGTGGNRSMYAEVE